MHHQTHPLPRGGTDFIYGLVLSNTLTEQYPFLIQVDELTLFILPCAS